MPSARDRQHSRRCRRFPWPFGCLCVAAAHQSRQPGDKTRIDADGHCPPVERHATALRQPAVIAVELDEGLGMLRDKRDWCDDDANLVLPGPPDLLVARRPEPRQRPDPALLTNPPVL